MFMPPTMITEKLSSEFDGVSIYCVFMCAQNCTIFRCQKTLLNHIYVFEAIVNRCTYLELSLSSIACKSYYGGRISEQ